LYNTHSLDLSHPDQPAPTAPSLEAATHSHSHLDQKSQILLATAMVLVRDAFGNYRLGRALLDSRSLVNFITEDFVQRLHFRRDRHSVQIRSFRHLQTDIKHCTTTSIKSRVSSYVEVPITARHVVGDLRFFWHLDSRTNASSIDRNLKRLWELEAVDSLHFQKPEHSICEEQYRMSTRLDSTGRIIVKLPFKDDPSRLGSSFDTARHWILSIERRLWKSSKLRQQYCDFMEEY